VLIKLILDLTALLTYKAPNGKSSPSYFGQTKHKKCVEP